MFDDKIRVIAQGLVKVWISDIKFIFQRLTPEKRKEFLTELHYYTGLLMAKLSQEQNETKYSHKPPEWFKTLMEKPWLIANLNRALDHVSFTKDEVISQPYQLEFEDIVKVVGFCLRNGLKFTISGDTDYFPGYTFRITFSKVTGSNRYLKTMKEMLKNKTVNPI